MKNEIWKEWQINHTLEDSYTLESMLDTSDKIKITLTGNTHKILVQFNGLVFGYRRSHKGRENTISSKTSNVRYPIFNIKNSSFLSWIAQESKGVNTDQKLFHYRLVTNRFVIDVAYGFNPTVEIIDLI